MAYDKKYPEINDFILDFDKGQEDRTESEFNLLNERLEGKIVNRTQEITLTGGGAYVWWDNTPIFAVMPLWFENVGGVSSANRLGVVNVWNTDVKRTTTYFYNISNGVALPEGTKLTVQMFYYA